MAEKVLCDWAPSPLWPLLPLPMYSSLSLPLFHHSSGRWHLFLPQNFYILCFLHLGCSSHQVSHDQLLHIIQVSAQTLPPQDMPALTPLSMVAHQSFHILQDSTPLFTLITLITFFQVTILYICFFIGYGLLLTTLPGSVGPACLVHLWIPSPQHSAWHKMAILFLLD